MKAEAPNETTATRVHDLRGALRGLQFLCDSMAQGYRFDDAAAAEKIAALQRIQRILDREGSAWIEVLESKS